MSQSSSTTALRIEQLSKRYANGTQALSNLSLSVEAGEFFGLLGQNGAGKTTLLSILTSLTRKTSGKVWVHGVDIDHDFSRARRYLGIVPQEFNFMPMEKVLDIILYQAGYYGHSRRDTLPKAEAILKKLELWHKRHSPARSLSGGMKRRLMIARAMVCEPKILILDEPTAGVDVEIRHSMWQYLKQLNESGTTIILTSHYLEEIETLCDRVAIIQQGKMIRDTSVAKLVGELPHETFIMDLSLPIEKDLELQLGDIKYQLINSEQIKVDLHKGQDLNAVFQKLETYNIKITSMRAESNRLESLFLSLTNQHKK